ncbi:MAG TPA: 50S ribosomal protein L28 [Anaerolineae bacterium]|nr:50S ribosomal protein L28 [Anaerolineae bacterium]
MAKCEICGKGPMFGHNVSHSKRATNRIFRANIQRKRLLIDGKLQRVQICTRCLRTLSRDQQ